VEEASQRIAVERGNHEFWIGLSRLADIENKGTVPSVYRLYSLCAIYGLQFETAMRWYGIDLQYLAEDSSKVSVRSTRPIEVEPPDDTQLSFPLDLANLDSRRTTDLSHHVRRWGKLPLGLLTGMNPMKHRYAFIGTADWSMYPIIRPGSFLQIDDTKRKIADSGWSSEYDRPIYFVEHRDGYCCGWCSETSGFLIVHTHSASQEAPRVFRLPSDAEIVGQVVGIAMRLDQGRRRHIHS
jgi:hypothetical protein